MKRLVASPNSKLVTVFAAYHPFKLSFNSAIFLPEKVELGLASDVDLRPPDKQLTEIQICVKPHGLILLLLAKYRT